MPVPPHCCFGREGATVICVDRTLDAAEETAALIRVEGHAASSFAADITQQAQIKDAVARALRQHQRIDVPHNNVGVSIAGGDTILEDLTEEAFDNVFAINLRGMATTCKHVVPIMRAQHAGSIVNISSMAVVDMYPYCVV